MARTRVLRRRVVDQQHLAQNTEPPALPRIKFSKAVNTWIEYKDLLDWQKDNEFVVTGYRPMSFSYRECWRSIVQLHNETVNIWSHCLGSIAFATVPLALHWTPHEMRFSDLDMDKLMLGLFFMCVTLCFLFSMIFHTFLCHSREVYRICNQLDHLGIVLVIWGSTIPSAHFGFRDDIHLRNGYWIVATFAAVSCVYVSWQPSFRIPQGRQIRFVLYSLLGTSAFLSGVHGVLLHGFAEQNRRMSLSWFLGLGLLNFTGAVVYSLRIPERFYPGKFDMYGASHQIMHVLVMCGAVSHTVGLLKAHQFWRDRGPYLHTHGVSDGMSTIQNSSFVSFGPPLWM